MRDTRMMLTSVYSTAQGDYYIVNGAKKFITGGTRAAYFTTAVRTGGAGRSCCAAIMIQPSHRYRGVLW